MDNYQIDEELHRISKKISFADLRPVNVDEEREKFFKNKDYNPQFVYTEPHYDLNIIRDKLRALEPSDDIVGKILKGIILTYLHHIDLIENRGTDNFSAISRQIHGEPDARLVKKAKKLLYLKIKPETKEYSTDEIIKKLRVAFVKYGFHWTIEERYMVASAAVELETKKLLVKKNTSFSSSFLRRIIVHEIGTHVMRSENGLNQPYKFFARGLPGYLMTEEGLAVFNEEQHDCLNNFVLKVYAGRVLSIHSALTNSFADTYSLLRKYFTMKTAWRLTLRAKRGLKDTTQPGAFTKDIAYLKGYVKVKKFVENQGDINRLYYGKIGLQHLNLIEQIPGLIHPNLLPMFRYINFLQSHFTSAIDSIVFNDGITPVKISNLNLD